MAKRVVSLAEWKRQLPSCPQELLEKIVAGHPSVPVVVGDFYYAARLELEARKVK